MAPLRIAAATSESQAIHPIQEVSGQTLIFPWLFFCLNWVSFAEMFKRFLSALLDAETWNWKKIAPASFTICGYVILIALGIYLRDYEIFGIKIMYLFSVIFSGTVALAMAVVGTLAATRYLSMRWRDRKILKQDLPNAKMSLTDLATLLLHLSLDSSRQTLLQAVYDKGIYPTGHWPNGLPPDIGRGKAASFLAQLEAKWRGIDR